MLYGESYQRYENEKEWAECREGSIGDQDYCNAVYSARDWKIIGCTNNDDYYKVIQFKIIFL